jgi:hypothetical protein
MLPRHTTLRLSSFLEIMQKPTLLSSTPDWGRPTPLPATEDSSAVQPAEGEVAELAGLLREVASAWEPDARLLGNMTAQQFARAADLLSRLSPPQPVPDIIPKPQFPSPRTIREDFLP